MEQEEYLQGGRVIITAGRSLMALVAAHSLGKKGIEVIGADCLTPNLLSLSSYTSAHEIYTNPEESPEEFLLDLKNIISKHRPDGDRPYVLMPTFRQPSLIIEH